MKGLAAIVLLLVTVNAAGQMPSRTPCKVGKDAPGFGFWSWASGSTIEVYVLAADFDSNELPYVVKPLQNWNAVANASGSRVIFNHAGFVEAPRYCDNCLTIMRGPVFDKVKRHASELRAYSARDNQLMTWAHIVIDSTLTNPRAITNAVAHELGHSFGLLDCYSCKHGSTVMTQFKSLNQPNEIEGPTTCDIAQVNAAYKELAVRFQPSPKKKVVVDEGEEPVDDDNPVIVLKP